MSAYIKKLRVPIYEWTIYFFGDREKAIGQMRRQKVPKTTIDFWEDATLGGVTSYWPEDREIYIGVFRDDAGMVAHECVHAAVYMLEDAGIPIYANNHEALTYLVHYLVNQYHEAVAAKNTKRKK